MAEVEEKEEAMTPLPLATLTCPNCYNDKWVVKGIYAKEPGPGIISVECTKCGGGKLMVVAASYEVKPKEVIVPDQPDEQDSTPTDE